MKPVRRTWRPGARRSPAGAELIDQPIVHDGDPVDIVSALTLVVGDEHEG